MPRKLFTPWHHKRAVAAGATEHIQVAEDKCEMAGPVLSAILGASGHVRLMGILE